MRVDVYTDKGELLFTNTEETTPEAEASNRFNCDVGMVTNVLMWTLSHRDLIHPRKGFWAWAHRALFDAIRWETSEQFQFRREWQRHREDPQNYPRPNSKEWRDMWNKINAGAH